MKHDGRLRLYASGHRISMRNEGCFGYFVMILFVIYVGHAHYMEQMIDVWAIILFALNCWASVFYET